MSTRQHRILVVDDEPDIEHLVLQRMRREIRRGDYIFEFAGNGVEALERLSKRDDVDMVVSDINMPHMDGLTLLEQIPKVDPSVKSVIVSAYGDMKNIRTAMNRGAFDFVTKPIDFEDLRVTIDRTLEHLEMLREALASRDKLVAIQHELGVASQMQQSILPKVFPKTDHLSLHASMTPARDVGGDFYDFVPLTDGKIGMTIADVSDKGVPAALFMMSSRTMLKGSAIGLSEPQEVLAEVNDLLETDNTTAMFVTVLYAVYDPRSGELTYASGGHDPPIVVRSDGTVEVQPNTGGIALGIAPGFKFSQNTVQLQPGDRVAMFTDGVTEAARADEEQFGLTRLQETLAAIGAGDAEDLTAAVLDAVHEFVSDAPQSDDITFLSFCRH
ncbi:MAG: SpoIIE family protein phosphatase [Gammaproteobacteria bacterium]|nr:SpoIIE family protein phosphatase [Gammaproteobacteria bacterium]MCY4323901.1 SpoIIE family protein phosphatase [Gammaproteobacteria bacterium]